MKIALLGYGKMGKEIEAIALKRGHEISLKIDAHNLDSFNPESLNDTEVAIEFSTPETAYANIQICFAANVPVVAGTTGWLNKMEECIEQCNTEKKGLFYASNFSVGVNVFFEINKKLAQLMDAYPGYQVSMEEIHHTQKIDAPSGTAITLAEGIIENNHKINHWVNDQDPKDHELNIASKRIDKVPGTHSITYENEIDEIYICHTAHNRKGFALGAVLASEFMDGKAGYYGMKEMMGF